MQGNEAVGNRVKAKIVKNKVAPPFRSAEFDIMFAHGISKEGDLMDLGVQIGLINKSGAFFSYGDVRLGQGRENAKTYLEPASRTCCGDRAEDPCLSRYCIYLLPAGEGMMNSY